MKPWNGPHRRYVWAIAALAAAIALGYGVVYYIHSLSYVSTDDAFIEGHIVPISPRVSGHVIRVLIKDNQRVAQGDVLVELDPKDFEVALASAKAALQVAEAEADSSRMAFEATRITSGAGIEEASSSLLQSERALRTSEVRLQKTHSQLAQSRAEERAAHALAQQAESDVEVAKAQNDLAQVDLSRARKMFAGSTISRQALDRAVSTAQSSQAAWQAARQKASSTQAQVLAAKAAVKTAEGAVRELESQIAEARATVKEARARLAGSHANPKRVLQQEAEVRVAEAKIAQARSAVERARLQLSYTKVHAPVAGQVTRRTVEVGQYIQAGQAMMTLVPPKVWVVANFKETQLTGIRPGQPVSIEVDAYPDVTFRGHVDSIQAGTGSKFSLLPPENATGNYVKVVQRVPVRIVFDHTAGLERYTLAPGMSVEPEVDISPRPH